MTCSERQLVTFRAGFVADWAVVQVLLELEALGAQFELVEPNRFRVSPSSLLTPAVRAFLTAHRDEVHRVLTYAPKEPM
jgi:hypothetical protein